MYEVRRMLPERSQYTGHGGVGAGGWAVQEPSGGQQLHDLRNPPAGLPGGRRARSGSPHHESRGVAIFELSGVWGVAREVWRSALFHFITISGVAADGESMMSS